MVVHEWLRLQGDDRYCNGT